MGKRWGYDGGCREEQGKEKCILGFFGVNRGKRRWGNRDGWRERWDGIQ